MQPDFQHTMIVVITVCGLMFAIGATLLLFAFRAYGTARRGDIKHVVLLIAGLVFIGLCCVALLLWSSLQR